MKKIFRKTVIAFTILSAAFFVLTGCNRKDSKKDKEEKEQQVSVPEKDYLSGIDTDTLMMDKDGSLIEIACDDYSKESFDYSGLSDDIQKEIDSFNQISGSNKVSFLQYSDDAGKVKVAIKYMNIQAYNDFNGTYYKLEMYDASKVTDIVVEEEKKKNEAAMSSAEGLAEAGIDNEDEDEISSIKSDAVKAIMTDRDGKEIEAADIKDESLMMLITDQSIVFDADGGEVRYVNHHASINGKEDATSDGNGLAVIVFTLGVY